jgi:hypothetical protein
MTMPASTKIRLGLFSAAIALLLAGCAARAKNASATPAVVKPAAPAPPPTPVKLSTPQTQMELPKPQPYDAAALETAPAVPADTSTKPAATPPPRTIRPPHAETSTPAPPPTVTPAEPVRPPMQEIISATDIKRLQESAQSRKREVAQILEQVRKRRLNKAQQIAMDNIRGLVKLSDDYEKRNEMPQADTMAERALILARQLQNGH